MDSRTARRTFFKEKGITTIAYDLRGHKQEKVCIDTFNQFVEDTTLFLEWVENHYPGILHSNHFKVVAPILFLYFAKKDVL